MRVALVGSGLLVTSLLRPVLTSSHEVVALIEDGRKLKGWRRRIMPKFAALVGGNRDRRSIARRHGIPLFFIDKMTEDELAPLRALDPDLILVGGFAIILKKPILDLPKLGCVNTHSSLLPKHRGPNPFAAVLLTGEKETGVTFHVMDEDIDTGDILAQYALPVEDNWYALDLHRATSELAGEHVVDVLDKIEAEGLRGTPQDPALATYEKKLSTDQTVIDWSQPAADIVRLIRAGYPMTMARFRYGDRVIFAHFADVDPEPVDAEPGTVLVVRPHVKVATSEGSVVLKRGARLKPFPWVWPGVFDVPKPGDRLE